MKSFFPNKLRFSSNFRGETENVEKDFKENQKHMQETLKTKKNGKTFKFENMGEELLFYFKFFKVRNLKLKYDLHHLVQYQKKKKNCRSFFPQS